MVQLGPDRVERLRTGRPPAGVSLRYLSVLARRSRQAREGGRCAFIGSHGRCTETGRLEFHHLIPFAHGGATDVANISLRCRAPNSFEGNNVFGPCLPKDAPRATRSGPG